MSKIFNPVSFTVDRANLAEVLRSMQTILDKKDIEHSSLQINIEKDRLSIIASDGSMFVESSLECVVQTEIATESIYLPASILYDLVRRLDCKDLTFRILEKQILLEYPEGNFTLARLYKTSSYSMIEDSGSQFTVNLLNLIDALKLLKSTMASDDIREQFKGISVIIQEQEMTLWSTDGLKMSLTKLNLTETLNIQGIWPRKLIDTICTTTAAQVAHIMMSERHIKFYIGSTIIASPLINAKLLDYKMIIDKPENLSTTLVVDSQYLIKKLDRMMILIENEVGILFEIKDEPKAYSTNKQQSDRAAENLDGIQWTGMPCQFYLNGGVLVSFLRYFRASVELKYYAKSKNIVVSKLGEEYPFFLTKIMEPKKS